MLTADRIVAAASAAIFGKPLVTNVYRSVIAEAIVDAALTDWEWCSADYAAYDFLHPKGLRLEVKQSAVKQSWASKSAAKPSWDIKPRTGYWDEASEWAARSGRNADIYVFGLHHVADHTADHRDPDQWVFYVLPTAALPPIHRLTKAAVDRLVTPVPVAGMRTRVENILNDLIRA